MIFSELYSAYYNTVARIITAAFDKNTTEKDLDRIVSENAFSESVLTIMPSLKSGKWKLLDSSLKPLLRHEPTMPLTLLQKRWLKAVSLDKRVRLFDVQFPDLYDVEPLFTEDELAVFKRGRNASKASVAKHASPEEYRASTGFECLLGWLYLNGQLERVHQLFEVLWQQFDPDQK